MGDYNSREMNGDMEYNRDKLLNPYTLSAQDTFFHTQSFGDFERVGARGGLRAGADWAFTESDNLGINVRVGTRDMQRNTFKDYEEWITPSDVAKSMYRTADSSMRGGTFYSFTMDYKHVFDENKDHYLQLQSVIDG